MSQSASDSFRNVTRYLGQDYRFAPTYIRSRDPTVNDVKPKEQQGFYPITSFWSNSTNGNLWVLVSFFNSPVQAKWILIESGTQFRINEISQTTAGSYTYTPTSGMISCMVEIVGAGGGGGGAGSTTSGFVAMGGGGGAGAYARGFFSSTQIGSSQSYVVGSGGAGGSNSGGNGGNGNASSFGSFITCNGGGGGIGGTSSAFTSSTGGAGGTASGAGIEFSSVGNSGGVGFGINIMTLVTGVGVSAMGFIIVTGYGANSYFGAGGQPLNATGASSQTGNNGVVGAGGSGALSNAGGGNTGGVGGAGCIIITEYIFN